MFRHGNEDDEAGTSAASQTLVVATVLYNSAKKAQWSFCLWIFLAQNLALICFLMFM